MMPVSMTAVEEVEKLNTEKQIEQEVSSIEAAANSLLYNEEISDSDAPAPTREITLSFPQDSLTATEINELRLENLMDGETPSPVTHVTYNVEGRQLGQQIIDAPVVSADRGPIELEGARSLDLQLRLEQDENGNEIVVVERKSGTIPDAADFQITDLTTNSPVVAGETGTITATVTNTGDVTDSQTVEFEISGLGNSPRRVTLDGGETTTETFSFSAQNIGKGDHTLEVTSENDSDSQQVTIGTSLFDADRWSSSGPGNAAVSDSETDTVTFSYEYNELPTTGQEEEWTYETTAKTDREVTVDWTFAGHHSWYKSDADAYLSINGDEMHLSDTAGNGHFSDAGTKQVSISEGDTIEIRITGFHRDRAKQLYGEFTLTI